MLGNLVKNHKKEGEEKMALKSMYFFSKDESSRKFLVIRIEGEKKEVAKSLVGVILGERVHESLSEHFSVTRVEFTRSGTSYSLSMGEVNSTLKTFGDIFKRKRTVCATLLCLGVGYCRQ